MVADSEGVELERRQPWGNLIVWGADASCVQTTNDVAQKLCESARGKLNQTPGIPESLDGKGLYPEAIGGSGCGATELDGGTWGGWPMADLV